MSTSSRVRSRDGQKNIKIKEKNREEGQSLGDERGAGGCHYPWEIRVLEPKAAINGFPTN